MDFYSCILDQRLSIAREIKPQIMMGQPWTKSTKLTVLEEEDRDAAGYTNPYVPKKNHIYQVVHMVIFITWQHWQDMLWCWCQNGGVLMNSLL
jgi:hypothetical protein